MMTSNFKRYFFLLCLVVGSYFLGLLFYCKGFLLTRQALMINSTCADVQYGNSESTKTNSASLHSDTSPNSTKSDNISRSCWIRPRFRRAVFVIVDALRYDFTVWLPNNTAVFPYQNKLPVIHRLLSEQRSNSLLFKFVADPPTTTLQRLKALTTGTLPTFIDVGSNFGGSEILEDNVLDQIRKRNRNVTFMGDDTWTSLYPNRFLRQYPFPSFDVKDLHTVDDGVLSVLYEELAKPDWHLLIAHFLGVDHCGHKYSPNHPEMDKKLSQMNQAINDIVDVLEEDTILFVLGDHGMTPTGDHGGDSQDELGAALFAYSPAGVHNNLMNVREAVSQVDLVPTMSLLLDVPIPFSSLGKVIPDFFQSENLLKQATSANTMQVIRYAETYSQKAGDFTLSRKLDLLLRYINSLDSDELTPARSLELVGHIQQTFAESWAKFHNGWMMIGLLILLENLLWSCRLLWATAGDGQMGWDGKRFFLKMASFLLMGVALLREEETVPPVLGMLLAFQIVHDTHGFAVNLLGWTGEALNRSSIFALFGLFLNCIAMFSNSYVVYEDRVSRFISQTLVGILLLSRVQTNFTRRRLKCPSLRRFLDSSFGLKPLMYSVTAMGLLRLGSMYNRCREEQGPDCSASGFTVPFASLSDETAFKAIRFLSGILSLYGMYAFCHWFLKRNGHFLGYGWTCLAVYGGSGMCVGAVSAYWVTLWLPETVTQRYADIQIVLPGVVYVVFLFFWLLYCGNPVLSHSEWESERKLTMPSDFVDKKVLFEQVKQNWHNVLRPETRKGKIIVYGLASGYSGSLMALACMVSLVLALLLGEGISSSLFAALLTIVVVLELGAPSDSFVLPLWCVMAQHFFYAFGHHATFSSIPWEAAFIGLPGNFRFQSIQALPVILNLNAAHVLNATLLPLLVVWARYSGKMGNLALNQAELNSTSTEYDIASKKNEDALKSFWRTGIGYLSLLALKMLAVSTASAVHRRHLMVWKIFAPKFIFEGVSFFVSCVVVIVMFFVVSRLTHCVEKIK